jgi:hypothetical protein
MEFWRTQAFVCADSSGQTFPSKELHASASPSECRDGDMTLFNGLLCAAGELAGCDGVKRAQDQAGRWWRSPRLVGIECSQTDTDCSASFSPDMAWGALLYLAQTKDRVALDRWLGWISRSRPCLVNVGFGCLLAGWPRLCTDDFHDKICTFRPTTCASLEAIGEEIGVGAGAICREILGDQLKVLPPNFQWEIDSIAAADAIFNQPGFPLHLAAVHVFFLEKIGRTSVKTRFAAVALAVREPRNPFFLWLSEGPSKRVEDLVLERCPSRTTPAEIREEWVWEREYGGETFRRSMYWECIFMGKLLGR